MTARDLTPAHRRLIVASLAFERFCRDKDLHDEGDGIYRDYSSLHVWASATAYGEYDVIGETWTMKEPEVIDLFIAANEDAAAEILGWEIVSAYIVSRGEDGATDEEGQEALAMPGNTYRPRRTELQSLGLVRDSGARRETKSGRKAVVWCATGRGQ